MTGLLNYKLPQKKLIAVKLLPNIPHKVITYFAGSHLARNYSNKVYNIPLTHAALVIYFSGDYTLDINPVELEDDARFQCQIGASEGVAPIRSRYATLTVLVPPEPPKLLPSGDLHKTVEGRQVELRCESRGGKPASEVSKSVYIYILQQKQPDQT